MPSPVINRKRAVDVDDAWRESCLADVPRAAADRLLDGSRLLHVASGDPFHRAGADPETVSPAVVVDGLLRIFRTGPDGRQVTVRYVTSGGFVGLAVVLGQSWSAASLAAEALRDSTLLELRPGRFEAAIRDEPRVAGALCRYLFGELVEAQHTLSADLMLPVRSRVACHLLNLAEREERELVVHATPQHLAAAVGSVREVVSRVLRHMEQIGLVQRRAGRLVLVDSAGLHRIWAGESGL
jgi:CRP/FNR family transcriptional regulator, cyclic AMP receptor protein